MSSVDPAQHAVQMPTRTKLVTEGSQKAVYPILLLPPLFPLTPHPLFAPTSRVLSLNIASASRRRDL